MASRGRAPSSSNCAEPDEFQLTTKVDGEFVHSLKYVRSKDDPEQRIE